MQKEKMYMEYRGLIFKAIKDLNCYYKTNDEYQEYFDSWEIGLLNALNNYDSTKNANSSYFYTCIINSIKRTFIYKKSNKRVINYLEKDSLDGGLLEDKDLYNIIADETINIENEILKKEQYDILYKAINMLKPTYKEIICKYYGINCKKETLGEIAKNYNISRQALNAKKDNALQKIRKYYKSLGGDYYDWFFNKKTYRVINKTRLKR